MLLNYMSLLGMMKNEFLKTCKELMLKFKMSVMVF